ncbi:MAG: DUF1667 domain-containing protein [Tissierellia bacterium]|nr:DUF1667 domain-containing protein [Tissierellia bacterium]
MVYKTICKVCPVGCEVSITGKDPNTITGNRCGRGGEYIYKQVMGKSEVLTGRMPIEGGIMSKIPVQTSEPLPSDLRDKILSEINSSKAVAPVKKGEVLIENVLGTGVDVIASRAMKKRG